MFFLLRNLRIFLNSSDKVLISVDFFIFNGVINIQHLINLKDRFFILYTKFNGIFDKSLFDLKRMN